MKRTPPSTGRRRASLFVLLATTFGLLSFYYSNAPENAIPPVTVCEQSLSYDVRESRFYIILDTTEIQHLTALDKNKLRRTTENKHFEICMDSTGEVTTEIGLLNPEDVFETWMKKITRTVIDKDSVKSYNSSGGLVFSSERSGKSKKFYDSIKAGLNVSGLGVIPSFEELTSTDIQNLESHGFSVQQLQL